MKPRRIALAALAAPLLAALLLQKPIRAAARSAWKTFSNNWKLNRDASKYSQPYKPRK